MSTAVAVPGPDRRRRLGRAVVGFLVGLCLALVAVGLTHGRLPIGAALAGSRPWVRWGLAVFGLCTLAGLVGARMGYSSDALSWRDAVGDLRWRIAGLVVMSTMAICAALSVLTLHSARDEASVARQRELAIAFDSAVTQVTTQLAAHPQARSGAELRGLAVGFPVLFAVGPVTSGHVDTTRLGDASYGQARPQFTSMPASCFTVDADTVRETGGVGNVQHTWQIECNGHPLTIWLVPAPAGAAVPTWAVLAVDLRSHADAPPGLGQDLEFASALLVLLSAAIAWDVAGRVQRPVAGVRRAAEAVAAGDLSARAPRSGSGELGRLGHAVDAMADRLTEQIGVLEEHNEQQRRFVSDVAHELRTPSAALLASATALENPVTRDAAAQRVVPQVRRLASLTDDLLEISRMDAGQATLTQTRVDLSDLVRQVVAECCADAGVPVSRVRLEVPDELLTTLDAARVSVVVRNLVGNALRHGRPPVSVGLGRGNDRLHLGVSDAGDGVPVELRARVFDRFMQADPSRHGAGTGLGLAIARANAQLLGGELALSDDGRTFELTLPGGEAGRE